MVKKVLEYAVRSLVSNPESVIIRAVEEDSTNKNYEVVVDDQDRGRVIGKDGQTVRALRLLGQSVAPEGVLITVTVL